MADDNSTVPSQRKSRRRGRNRHRRRKNKQPAPVVDSISSLPDDILKLILSFTPTKYAIRTSALSKRWRHVWCDTPSLSFHNHPPKDILKPAYINETLKRYTALKMMRFHFEGSEDSVDYIDKWIGFAMSRNVENLSFDIWLDGVEFELPDYFYNSSSLKQLTLVLYSPYVNPTCYVSWTSLKNLALHWCKVPNESIAKILSGCPILESLTLFSCKELSFLDLSKYPNLTTLRLGCWTSLGPTEIVVPHIHSLKLRNSHIPYTLLDVSSLTEAKLDTSYFKKNFDAYFLQVKLLEILQNVEKLTLGECFLQILSLAEIRGVPLPIFKMKSMTIKTSISQYVIPGVKRMLQNSPHVKKITLHIRTSVFIIDDRTFDTYVQNLINPDQSWRSKNGFRWNKNRSDVRSSHVISFMEFLLENAEALEKLVVQFQDDCRKFIDMIPPLSNKNNVSILLSTKPSKS